MDISGLNLGPLKKYLGGYAMCFSCASISYKTKQNNRFNAPIDLCVVLSSKRGFAYSFKGVSIIGNDLLVLCSFVASTMNLQHEAHLS